MPPIKDDVKPHNKLSVIEFTLMLALMVSMSAMSTDMMLPALGTIGENLGAPSQNSPQFIISAILLGLTFGQILYGPLSDSFGRRPLVFAGFGIFMLGTLICIFANSFNSLLAGRLLQGLGAAGPRVVSTSIIRDLYAGREMAKILSIMMSFFIIVPAIAPVIGQFILSIASWREIFYVLFASSFMSLIWFGFRQSETLKPEYRRIFSVKLILSGFAEVAKIRICLLGTIMAGLMMGAFYGFLMSSPQVFAKNYGVTDKFPLYFTILALCCGLATVVNAKLVLRLGMRRLCKFALLLKCATSFGLLILLINSATIPLNLFVVWACLVFFVHGFLFGNFNAMAMEPVGHLAGVGAAFVATLSSGLAVAIGTLIGQSYNGTIIPLVASFAGLAITSLIIMKLTPTP